MKRTYTTDVKKGGVFVEGWVQEIRDLGKIVFLILRDMTGIIQITAHEDKVNKKLFEEIKKIPRESVIVVEGKVVENKQAPNGKEILPDKIEILAEAEQPLPIDTSDFSKTDLSKRLDWRSLDLRNIKNSVIFKIQAKIVEGMQGWLNKNKFMQVFTPCMIGTASESGAEVFQVLYFNKSTFLRQDPQLHRQLTIATGFDRIYDLGPSWRAELSHTTKHLCEHRGCAVELAFIKDERDTMKAEEQLIVAALKKVQKDCKKELKLLNVKIKIPKTPFPEITFEKVKKIVGKKIEDIDTATEKKLYNYVKKKYKTNFYFINRFPFAIKPFYVMRVDSNPKEARSVDLYFKDVEMSSGGQREHRYKQLMQNIKEKKMNAKQVEWFTKFFKYGVPPHGGFNIGIERLTMVLLNIPNVRETTLFPRDPERTTP